MDSLSRKERNRGRTDAAIPVDKCQTRIQEISLGVATWRQIKPIFLVWSVHQLWYETFGSCQFISSNLVWEMDARMSFLQSYDPYSERKQRMLVMKLNLLIFFNVAQCWIWRTNVKSHLEVCIVRKNLECHIEINKRDGIYLFCGPIFRPADLGTCTNLALHLKNVLYFGIQSIHPEGYMRNHREYIADNVWDICSADNRALRFTCFLH